MQSFYPFIWIAFIICLFLMWFFTHRANHKERMLMIEKGIDLEHIKKRKPGFSFPWRKLVAVIIGLSIGMLILSLLASAKLLDGNALPLAVLGLSGGLAMLISDRKKNDKSGE